MEVILKLPIVLKGEKAAQSMEHAIRVRSLVSSLINFTAYFITNTDPLDIFKKMH